MILPASHMTGAFRSHFGLEKGDKITLIIRKHPRKDCINGFKFYDYEVKRGDLFFSEIYQAVELLKETKGKNIDVTV